MLDLTPGNLLAEIKAAESARDEVLKSANRIKKLYFNAIEDGKTLENHPFEFVKRVLPNIVFTNPRIEVTTRLPASEGPVAESHEYALNDWVNNINLAEELVPVAYEFLFTYGVVHMSIRSQPGYDDNREFVPQRPFPSYIQDCRFFIDRRATYFNKARLMGHHMFLDREALEADPRVNSSILGDLQEDARRDDKIGGQKRKHEAPPRKDVKVYEVWVPEKTLESNELPKRWRGGPPTSSNGYHGTIYTLTDATADILSDENAWLREPRPCYCPPWGPYILIGAFHRSGDAIPLSPLVLVKDQAVDVNDQAIAMSDSAKAYKRGVMCASEEIAEKMKAFKHDTFNSIPGFDPQQALNYEVGGVTNQMLTQQEINRDRLDRNSGSSDALRGKSEKGKTATADAIASEASQRQESWLESRWMAGVSSVVRSASWLIHYTPEVVFGVGDQAGDGQDAIFFGGTSQEDLIQVASLISPDLLAAVQDNIERGLVQVPSQGSWYNLKLSVDMFSMGRTNQALEQQKVMNTIGLVNQIAQIIPANPHIKWNVILDWLGEAVNKKGLGDIVDLDLAQEVFQLQLASGENTSEGGRAASIGNAVESIQGQIGQFNVAS